MYTISEKSILENIKNIVNSNSRINVLIDVGGLFVGITPIDIFNIIRNSKKELNNFIYWNDDDKPMSIDIYGNEDKWNNIITDNMFYYYDQKHTTGIDAEIIEGSVGAIFVDNTSIYRDVVQSIFRMRKITIEDNELFNKSHSAIIFVENNKRNIRIKRNMLVVKTIHFFFFSIKSY
jgi:hypothetical protein